MSIVLSHKQRAPGHTYRHILVKCILQNNIPIDIFGRGCKLYNTRDERLKGEFKDSEPYLNYFSRFLLKTLEVIIIFRRK